MTDPSQPLRDTLSELDSLRAELASLRQNFRNITTCLALHQLQGGDVDWIANEQPEFLTALCGAPLRLTWDAIAESGYLRVCLDGSDTPLTREDVLALMPKKDAGMDETQEMGALT